MKLVLNLKLIFNLIQLIHFGVQYINKDKIPNGYWNDVENVKHFMAYVAEKENYKNIEDWYKCT